MTEETTRLIEERDNARAEALAVASEYAAREIATAQASHARVSGDLLRQWDETRERLRQAEADRDAYAAVLRPLMRRAENERTWARCWDCGCLNRLDNHDDDCLAVALDALTDEQKERIT